VHKPITLTLQGDPYTFARTDKPHADITWSPVTLSYIIIIIIIIIVPYPMVLGAPFPRDKGAGAWNWPFTSI